MRMLPWMLRKRNMRSLLQQSRTLQQRRSRLSTQNRLCKKLLRTGQNRSKNSKKLLRMPATTHILHTLQQQVLVILHTLIVIIYRMPVLLYGMLWKLRLYNLLMTWKGLLVMLIHRHSTRHWVGSLDWFRLQQEQQKRKWMPLRVVWDLILRRSWIALRRQKRRSIRWISSYQRFLLQKTAHQLHRV